MKSFGLIVLLSFLTTPVWAKEGSEASPEPPLEIPLTLVAELKHYGSCQFYNGLKVLAVTQEAPRSAKVIHQFAKTFIWTEGQLAGTWQVSCDTAFVAFGQLMKSDKAQLPQVQAQIAHGFCRHYDDFNNMVLMHKDEQAYRVAFFAKEQARTGQSPSELVQLCTSIQL
jgi:hypothetical protein